MRQQRRKPRFRINKGPCPFCVAETTPDYKEVEGLRKFVTDRGKIIGRARSGVCQKHQRRLATAVKRGRHLGLISFVSSR